MTMFLLEVWWEFSFIFGLHFMGAVSMLNIAEWRREPEANNASIGQVF